MTQSDLSWSFAFLLVATFTFIIAMFFYFTGDTMKAIFWLVFSVGCEVSNIRTLTWIRALRG